MTVAMTTSIATGHIVVFSQLPPIVWSVIIRCTTCRKSQKTEPVECIEVRLMAQNWTRRWSVSLTRQLSWRRRCLRTIACLSSAKLSLSSRTTRSTKSLSSERRRVYPTVSLSRILRTSISSNRSSTIDRQQLSSLIQAMYTLKGQQTAFANTTVKKSTTYSCLSR